MTNAPAAEKKFATAPLNKGAQCQEMLLGFSVNGYGLLTKTGLLYNYRLFG
jgi:hypothetical protein